MLEVIFNFSKTRINGFSVIISSPDKFKFILINNYLFQFY